MLKLSLKPTARNLPATVLALAFGICTLCTGKALAATNWTAIQAAMKANGTVMPGDVLRFELSRHDLTMTVDGAPVPPELVEEVANGFACWVSTRSGRYPDSKPFSNDFIRMIKPLAGNGSRKPSAIRRISNWTTESFIRTKGSGRFTS